MSLKIISFIFVVSLAFGLAPSSEVSAVPFDVNEIIKRVNYHRQYNKSNTGFPNVEYGEFLVDTGIVYYASAPEQQRSSSIAFDGINYLIVWEDRRFSFFDIFGARVNQSGKILDPAGIAISTAADWQDYPSVAFGGTNYLVVWGDRRNDNSDIYGARINQYGVVLDPDGIAISTAEGIQGRPAVAFDGTNYLVVWEDLRSGSDYDIYCARVTQNGAVLDTSGITVSKAAYDQAYPFVAFDGSNYLIVWEDERSYPPIYFDIYGSRVSQSGVVLDTNGIAISKNPHNQQRPSVAFDGTNFLVVWEDTRNNNSFDIYGSRVNQAGIVIDSAGIPISTASDWEIEPSVAFDGTNYLVVWEDIFDGIFGSRINQSGVILDTNGIAILTSETSAHPSVAFDGTNYLVAWDDWSNDFCCDIGGGRVTQTGRVLDTTGILISTAAHPQYYPSAAFDSRNFFFVWQDRRNDGAFDIYGIRVNESGNVLEPYSFPISTAQNAQRFPSVAFDGSNYLIVWEDYRNDRDTSEIWGARVTQDGIILDTNGFFISTAGGDSWYPIPPSVVFGETAFLVVWEDHRIDLSGAIYGARVNREGVVLDPNGICISALADIQECPTVAYDGINYFVVWEDGRNGYPDIYGARVTQTGIVLDQNGILISGAVSYQRNPSVAFDGTNYLVVWADSRNNIYGEIYGARVNQAGGVLDPNGILISGTVDAQEYPSVAFDGVNYLVVWQNRRSGYDDIYDIYGTKINPSGVVINSFPVSIQDGNQYSPKIVRGSGNQALITYSGYTGGYQGCTYNSYRIWSKFYPFVGMEEENSKVNMQSAKLLEIYPNPAKSVIRVRVPSSEKEATAIKIFDVSGKLIKEIATSASQSRNDREVKISLKGINPGIYFLRLGKETKKFLVVK